MNEIWKCQQCGHEHEVPTPLPAVDPCDVLADQSKELEECQSLPWTAYWPNRDGNHWRTRAIMAEERLVRERDAAKEEVKVGLEISGSFFEALKLLNLQAINVLNPGVHVSDLIKRMKIAELKANNLHEFCSDCRDKVRGESCLRCQRDTALARIAALTKELEEHEHHIASHCSKPGHFSSPVQHTCKMCSDAVAEVIAAAREYRDHFRSGNWHLAPADAPMDWRSKRGALARKLCKTVDTFDEKEPR